MEDRDTPAYSLCYTRSASLWLEP